MKLSDVTALGRPIDLSYPTNRAIAAIMLAAFVITGLLTTWGTGLTVALSPSSPGPWDASSTPTTTPPPSSR